MFDSTMHYVLSRAMWLYFAQRKISLTEFDAQVNRAMALYPHAIQEVLWNFLGSHDTPRFLTRAGEDENRLRAAAFFQMTHPGVPIVYYGDELGLKGGPDPDCRRPMPWDKAEGNTLLAYYKQLIHLRNGSEALRRGTFKTWHTCSEGLYAYLRTSEKQEALVAFNTSDIELDIMLPLPEGFAAREEWLDHVSGLVLPKIGRAVRAKLAPSQGIVIIREIQ
jgi:glycosidase